MVLSRNDELLLAANKIGEAILISMKELLKLQGHRLTGKLEESLRFEVKKKKKGVSVVFFGLKYGIYLDKGVSPARVPFGGRRTGATKSLYIQGLQKFAEKRFFVNKKKALSIAFAIARKHKKEGIPTLASVAFSKTGERLNWIDRSVQKEQKFLNKIIVDFFVEITKVNQ